jgi:uncharacterized membrane protein YuzA (DUF378 family)
MRKLTALDWIALVLLIVGGLNWLLVGLFQFDLVATLFGGQAAIVSRIVYTLVGISAVYIAFDAFSFEKREAPGHMPRMTGA